ncbi:ImmA/IrrE family metallo-endopeptidase [Rhodococcoides trifolii]|nr:ImmA/IrrE family metallo-endopeptidase [Rhodococcus trifolii]
MTRWHPWRHLRTEHPDVDVEFHRHDSGCLGRWLNGSIEINPRSNQRERRCTLTHEIVHLERGPVPNDVRLARREETTVDRLTAHRLIALDALIDVLAWNRYRVDDEAAEELWVDLPTLITRVRTLTDEERRYIDTELSRRQP